MEKDKLQLRRVVGELYGLIEDTKKLAETTARAQDTRRTALMPGETMQIMDADGNVAAYFGGSNASGQLIEHVNGPEPKRPSAPELDSPMPGIITVIADGLDEDGEEARGNHDRVLIHLSHEEGFTPTEATAQHSFFGPEGRQDVSAEPGEWYVALQWKTKTGQLSEPSEQVMVEVEQLVDSADIQAALDDAQSRLDDARAEFEEMDDQRRQEIDNLNDVVLPALEATLADKAESSELPALEARLTTAFGEDLSAASDAAAKDATAKADAAREAAKDYADSELAVEAARITAAQEDAMEAMTAAEAAQATADGAIRTYYQPEPPTLSDAPNLGLGDLWYDTDNDQASRWDGAKWKVIQDSTIAQALGKAEAAQATADGKITAYYQDSMPSQGQVGDLWYDTGNDNKPHYCTAATPLEWVPVRDGEIANAELRAAQDALDKANAARDEAEDNAKSYADQQDATVAAEAATDAQEKADAAQAAAEAEADRLAKAEAAAAQSAAEANAAQDALEKANAARDEAVASSSDDATAKANAAKEAAETAAAADAKAKADAAQAEAIRQAALDATAKADAAKTAAEQAAKDYADQQDEVVKGEAAADAQTKADEVREVADAARDRAEAILRRGDNLIVNGSAELGTDAGWPSSVETAMEQTPSGFPGAFTLSGDLVNASLFQTETIAVDPARSYRYTARIKGKAGMRHYLALAEYDVDGLRIGHENANRMAGSETKLAEPVKDGDTYIVVEDASGWDTSLPSMRIGVWPYASYTGPVYQVEDGYTRNIQIATVANVQIEGNVIHLGRAWNSGSFPAGSDVAHMRTGSGYNYPHVLTQPEDGWVTLSGRTTAGVSNGVFGQGGSRLRPGCATIAVGFLINYQARVAEKPYFTGVRFVDATDERGVEQAVADAKEAQDAADAAQAKADEAHAEAGTAWTHADAAMTRAGEAESSAKDHADNMPKVLHGTGAPSGTAPDGSIWWRHQGTLSGPVIGQWNRVSGQWRSTPIDSDAIANLDVGKLTAGGAVISDAVIQDLTASNGAFDRLDAREGWIGGVALEDGAVTARALNAEEVFADDVVANAVWAEVVRAGLLTAEEALIGGALLKDGVIDASKINAESVTAAVAQFLEIEAGMIKANSFDGVQFTGNTFQTSDQPERGVKVRGPENDIVAYDAEGKLIMRIGDHQLNLLSGRLYTNIPGEEPGIILSEDKGDSVGASMQFSKDGVEGFRNPGVYTWAHHDMGQNDDLYSSVSLRGPSITSDGSTGTLTANSGSALAVSAISQVGAPTQGGLLAFSNSSQMFVGESWGDNTALLQPGSFRVDLEGGGRLSIDDRQVALGNGRGVSMVATDGVFFEVNGKRAFEINPSGSPRFYGDGRFLSNTFLDGQLQVDGAAWLRNETTFKGRTYFDDRPYFNDWTYHPGAPTSTNAANVRLGGTGYYMLRITSARDAKVNIEDMDVDEDKVLSLRPRTWFDRTETIDRLGNEAVTPTPDGPQSDERAALDAGLQRIPGLVAEEVEELGLEEFVIYEPDEDDHGKRVIESVAYDRIAIALIPSVRRNRERIIALEAENETLNSKVDDLEARLTALEAMVS